MVFFCDCWRQRPQQRRRRRRRQSKDPPSYRFVDRSSSVLLTACWQQDWEGVVARCRTHPHETFLRSRDNGRTALHLSTMPGASCPHNVLSVLIQVNPHAVVVEDFHRYGGTPLHFLLGSNHRNDPDLVQLFVDTAIQIQEQYPSIQLRVHGYSPLYLAARRDAPPRVFSILLETRHHQSTTNNWIAPWSGGETYHQIGSVSFENFHSPLDVLWNRAGFSIADLRKDDEQTQQLVRQAAAIAWQRDASSSLNDQLLQFHQHQETNSHLRVWIQCLLLLREYPMTTLVHTVACLYRPCPEMLQLVCDLFPELALQRDCQGRLPLHAVLRHPQINTTVKHQLTSILTACQPESVVATESDGTGLYPFAVAATQDTLLDTIFHLLVSDPQVLQLQLDYSANDVEPKEHDIAS